MKKKISLFKNEPYGIKKIIFHYKLERHIRKGIKVYTDILKRLLILSHKIGIPKSQEEKELLKKVINEYDKTILRLEENLKYARMYVEE